MLTVYRPFSMFRDINSALDSVWGQDVQEQVDYNSKLSFDDSNYYLKVVLPGFKSSEINVETKDGLLSIVASHTEEDKSEKLFRTSTSSFKKNWKLPKNIRTDAISAEYRSGILLLTLPRVEVKESARKINVTCSE